MVVLGSTYEIHHNHHFSFSFYFVSIQVFSNLLHLYMDSDYVRTEQLNMRERASSEQHMVPHHLLHVS